jgi:hypothetical protein
MAILCKSSKGVIKRRSKKYNNGVAASMRLRVPRCGNLEACGPASMSSSPNQLYLAKLEDAVDIGLLQLACHVSRYAESIFLNYVRSTSSI